MTVATVARVAVLSVSSPFLIAGPEASSTFALETDTASGVQYGSGGHLPTTPPVATREQIIAMLGVDEALAIQIEGDLDVRRQLHFNTDLDYVAGLRLHPDRVDPMYPEIPMSAGEAAEFAARQALAPDAEILESTLSKAEANSYAGVWLDNQTGELVVMVTQEGAEQARALIEQSSLAFPERVRLHLASHSRRDLIAVQQEFTPVVEDPMLDEPPYDLSVDVSLNRLTLRVPPSMPSEDAARLAGMIGRSGIEYDVIVADLAIATGGTLRNDNEAPPVYAGHGIIGTNNTVTSSPNSGIFCTNGFKVRRTSQPGREYALTAGHCFYDVKNGTWFAPVDSKVYYRSIGSNNIVAIQKAYHVVPSYDLALIEYSSATSSKIVVTAATNAYRGIDYMYSELPQGFSVCSIGATSNGARCGTIDTWRTGDGSIRANIANIVGGDRGVPLYAPRPDGMAAAVGINRGSNGSQIVASNVSDHLTGFCGDCVLVGS